ncbi:HNH endonuclease [Leclercia adecarboxylata ATCC 23216 = NBRC 102595]|nr:HNH endonuclease [Leclercia adecarboxylata ATCC 23216 = NBRC 102595]
MNDYKQMYLALCHYYQQNPPTAGYCEVHHITPRHVGGSDEAKNLVTLPFYYHVMAHVLYAKWKQTANAWAAVMMMTGNAVRHGVNIDLSHVALLREQAILAQLEKHLLSKKGPRYLNIEIIVLGSEIDAITTNASKFMYETEALYLRHVEDFNTYHERMKRIIEVLPDALDSRRVEILALLKRAAKINPCSYDDLPRYAAKDRKKWERIEREYFADKKSGRITGEGVLDELVKRAGVLT